MVEQIKLMNTRDVFRNCYRGGGLIIFLSRGVGSAPVGPENPPEIQGFHLSYGGFSPYPP